MCGIGGMIKMGERPIRTHNVRILANGLEYRGNDATGVAAMYEDGSTHWLKNNQPAWQFTASKDFADWAKEFIDDRKDLKIVLVHTRKATKGTPYKNDNNHPITAGEGIIIHNGMILNDDQLFRGNDWKRSCETDSDAIRALLDNHGAINEGIFEEMSRLSGFAAIAAVHPNSPGKLLLLRDSNPLMIGATNHYLAFASDKRVLHQALKPWVMRWGIPMQLHAPDISFIPMVNESGWILGPEGIEAHGKFKCNGFVGRGNTSYRSTATDYHERQERFRKEADEPKSDDQEEPQRAVVATVHGHVTVDPPLPEYVICPNFQCNRHVKILDPHIMKKLSDLTCKSCGVSLAGAVHTPIN